MEILNNTVFIQAELDMKTQAMVLKIPGKVLFDLYSNGKRCIGRFLFNTRESTLTYEFDIAFASKRYGRENGDQIIIYNFLATFYNTPNVETLIFESDAVSEPSYIREG